MGNKPSRTRKHILHYIAVSSIITSVSIVACTPFQDNRNDIKAHQQLEQYRENLADDAFETVIQQAKEVVAKNDTAPPADVALYALGEVYAHHDYEGRDYVLSQYYFEILIENFPESSLTSEAEVYISLFETIAAKEKAVTAEKQKSLVKEKKTAPVITLPRNLFDNENFEDALIKNLEILAKAGDKKPADEALYNLGLIYAHVNNPAKDFKKSQIYFQQLTGQFPDSELAEEAQIWLGLLETLEKIQQIDIDIEQQKKQLTR